MLTLSNLQVNKGAKKKKIRRGRGNASGYGNYSGRGMKGQRSRSGGRSGLKRMGMKKIIAQLPKKRGFNRSSRRFNIINLNTLEQKFKDGESVTVKKLIALGLISKPREGVKILAKGDIGKKLTVKAHSFSKTAKEAIIKAGGNVIETPFKKRSLLAAKKAKEVKKAKAEKKEIEKTTKPKEEVKKVVKKKPTVKKSESKKKEVKK
jgi:large subunit ribosomal protein L15